MLYSAHFFIGKEFGPFLEKLLLQLDENLTQYNYFYNVNHLSNSEVSICKLSVEEQDHQSTVEWTDLGLSSYTSWSNVFQQQIFNKILTISRSNQSVLPVFIYFPFYKAENIECLKSLCKGLESSGLNTNVHFIGYGDDMSEIIEPAYKIKSASSKQLNNFEKLRTELLTSKENSRFFFIHNSNLSGVSLGMNADSFVEMQRQFVFLFSSHLEEILPMDANDVTAVGFSSLEFDKYQFASYLLNRALLTVLENSSANAEEVDINQIYEKVNTLLYDKDKVLSHFLEKYKGQFTITNFKEIEEVIEEIRQKLYKILSENKDITFNAGILAALLSKPEYELFSNTDYTSNNACLLDLYSEAINLVIEIDEANYYKIDDENIINPIKAIKDVDNAILNSQIEVRELEERLAEQQVQVQDNENAQTCFIEDNTFHFQENKFKLLPFEEGSPLDEAYEAKKVTKTDVDLRKKFSRIKNQGQQGSCLSFAITSVFEYMMKINELEDCDLSEAFLYYNARHLDKNDDVSEDIDNGSRITPSLDSIKKYGIALEKYCPYNDNIYNQKPSEAAYKDAETRKLIKALNVEKRLEDIKSAISEGYPVVGSFVLCPSFNPDEGFIKVPTQEELQTVIDSIKEKTAKKHSCHAMVIVGYSDQLGMFIVRNSWGENWGDRGYCYLPYEYITTPELLNKAFIITEIASLQIENNVVRFIEGLKIDSSDAMIRYYIAKANLNKEKKFLEKKQAERIEYLEYFEKLRADLSNANSRKRFVEANMNKFQEEKNALNKEIKDLELQRDENEQQWVNYNKKRWFIFGASALLIVGIYFLLRWIFVESAICEPNEFLSSLWLIPAVLIDFLVFIISWFLKRRDWRELRDDFDYKIDNNKRLLKSIDSKMSSFNFKSLAAWTLIKSVDTLQNESQNIYSNLISLINNIRTWYLDIEGKNKDISFEQVFPKISLLEKSKLDKYFATTIVDLPEIKEFNLCEGIEKYKVQSNFINEFKNSITLDIKEKLIEQLEKIKFDISAHIAEDKFSELASEVTPQYIVNMGSQANVFVRINLKKRGDMPIGKILLAPSLSLYELKLRDMIVPYCGVQNFCELEGNYRIMLVTTASLKYEECVLLS